MKAMYNAGPKTTENPVGYTLTALVPILPMKQRKPHTRPNAESDDGLLTIESRNGQECIGPKCIHKTCKNCSDSRTRLGVSECTNHKGENAGDDTNYDTKVVGDQVGEKWCTKRRDGSSGGKTYSVNASDASKHDIRSGCHYHGWQRNLPHSNEPWSLPDERTTKDNLPEGP